VDLVVRQHLEEVLDSLRKRGIKAKLTRGEPVEGEFPRVRGEVDGICFDVLPSLVPLDWSRAIDLQVNGKRRLKVVDLDGLLWIKIRSGGPQDLVDVAMLVLLHPEKQEGALEIAEAYGVSRTLDRWLEDPRLKARARPRTAARRGRSRRK
jgi:hypothetical protein